MTTWDSEGYGAALSIAVRAVSPHDKGHLAGRIPRRDKRADHGPGWA